MSSQLMNSRFPPFPGGAPLARCGERWSRRRRRSKSGAAAFARASARAAGSDRLASVAAACSFGSGGSGSPQRKLPARDGRPSARARGRADAGRARRSLAPHVARRAQPHSPLSHRSRPLAGLARNTHLPRQPTHQRHLLQWMPATREWAVAEGILSPPDTRSRWRRLCSRCAEIPGLCFLYCVVWPWSCLTCQKHIWEGDE